MPTPFSFPIERATTPLPPEAMPQFWHPQRFGVTFAPDAIRRELLALRANAPNPEASLDCTWMPLDERWLIWQRDPTVTHHLCAGWSMKIVWEDPETHAYRPLDARLYADLYAREIWRFDSCGRGYFDRVCEDILRERAIRKKDTTNETQAMQRELIRSRRITNIGQGNKFALHHDGTIIPSRGERNWTHELERSRRPS